MSVDGSGFLDQCVDIGDGDEDFYSAVVTVFGDGQLIEVARLVVVDGTPETVAQVADVGAECDGRGMEGRELLKRACVEIRQQSPGEHGLPGDALQFGFMTTKMRWCHCLFLRIR